VTTINSLVSYYRASGVATYDSSKRRGREEDNDEEDDDDNDEDEEDEEEDDDRLSPFLAHTHTHIQSLFSSLFPKTNLFGTL